MFIFVKLLGVPLGVGYGLSTTFFFQKFLKKHGASDNILPLFTCVVINNVCVSVNDMKIVVYNYVSVYDLYLLLVYPFTLSSLARK